MGKKAIYILMLLTGIIVILGCQIASKTEPTKWSVGILAASNAKAEKIVGFKQGLADLGITEGKDVTYIILNAQGEREQLLPLARKLVHEKPDVLVATGGVEADALKIAAENQNIPIVFIGAASTVQRGIVKSFIDPGAQITGVDNYHAELAGKRLELLKKLLPYVQKVIVIYDPNVPPGYTSLKIVQNTAKDLGIVIKTIAVSSRTDFKTKLNRQSVQNYDAILPLSSFLIETLTQDLLAFSWQNKIPVMGIIEQEADRGYFAAYGVSMYNQGYQGARIVAKVLQGQQPKQIPVETPDNLELVVNLRTVERLGLKLNETGLNFARIIIK
ncbi:putative ABC transport system substrate-binding protein [Carboxydocella sporoproducens DSM 16521]|uniref:Putative ABC transport system substrate-binding protein n=2 Tax=Carboxydocella TaxID=178898 RepID=A0A1T4M7P0_9FIRM|nr:MULTISPECIES: ABC transporter substrate-binding protein [Carboxydocella]AVX21005.1 putative ABC transport system substrate-binding protein [Carboxydocella thermautotrophica]AVX31423.1 putative ABC transport system substrate-binding protein [Carboxydocella thermautotrophica]SJZ63050.1 putative ABC transport system substrate-binding protein [Carboxydocella sporoproducens DSM 16521]